MFFVLAGGAPPSAWACWPGVARRLLTFLLLRQKKSKQKKRRPWCLRPCASLRAACGARSSRGQKQLATLKQVFALIRLDLRSSAHTQGLGRRNTNTKRPKTKTEYLKP